MQQILKNFISDVPDFPKPGIVFRDISPLLRHHFSDTVDALGTLFSSEEWESIDVIAGIESRGFIFASALAYKYQKGLVKIRKKGKLPNPGGSIAYALEYGEDALEMHQGEGRIVLIDDVLATGGTLSAAADLCVQTGFDVAGFAVLINLATLNQFSWKGMHAKSVISYD